MASGPPGTPTVLFENDPRRALIASGVLLGASFVLALAVLPPPGFEIDAVLESVPHVVVPAGVARAGVVVPPRLRDAEPWPRGMVHAPAPTGDRIAILGGDVLSGLFGPLLDALRPAAAGLL